MISNRRAQLPPEYGRGYRFRRMQLKPLPAFKRSFFPMAFLLRCSENGLVLADSDSYIIVKMGQAE